MIGSNVIGSFFGSSQVKFHWYDTSIAAPLLLSVKLDNMLLITTPTIWFEFDEPPNVFTAYHFAACASTAHGDCLRRVT